MRILIGLGANLGDPVAAFRRALEYIGDEHRVVALSSLYRTRAVGPRQPDFLNMVAEVDASIDGLGLLDLCLRIEEREGRKRRDTDRWGPRPLDLDLLIASDVVHCGPRLKLPHPRLHERAFALVPAAELQPDWVHQLGGERIGELAEKAIERDPSAILERLPFERMSF
ncbi:MAG: 2-amino-4-hydroxy-6-hydroxymethyldihydropteridine diphosphokinase [bacterium]|nr:2-amino-4-hydroxy-6-hydroxymethyldihydropteridine diphosphokinase [bacterium]